MLTDPSSGVEVPAAVIVEPVQREGGVYPASADWLRRLRALTERHGTLLIADEIQTGCGRTGTFFSFEHAGIVPDLVTVSKAIGGYGLPLSLLLIRRTSTSGSRASTPALSAATSWRSSRRGRPADLLAGRRAPAQHPRQGQRAAAPALAALAQSVPGTPIEPRGRGLAHCLAFEDGELAGKVSAAAFERGLLVETAGPRGEAVKLLPPLTITDAELDQGLELLADAVRSVC